MNVHDIISKFHPDLSEKYKSTQYKLSEELIGKKVELKLTQKQMSILLNIPLEKYLEMESGSTDIRISEYELALGLING